MARLRPYPTGGGRATTTTAWPLARNEAPGPPSPAVLDAARSALATCHRYPSDDDLRADIAGLLGVAAKQVIVTNGLDELSFVLAVVFLRDGDEAVVGDPCFPVHELVTTLTGARCVKVPVVDGVHDLDAFAAACSTAGVAWLPNPHNPTGGAVDPERLAGALARIPTTCLVVLDEAYASFMDPSLRPDAAALAARHPNLVVARSMSKDHALAGLRLGFAWGHPDVISLLQRARPPFSPNAVAVSAARAALRDNGYAEALVAAVRDERERFQRHLAERGVPHLGSQANFVTLRLGDSAPQVARALETAGVGSRRGEDLGLPGCLRITIGTAAEMSRVREAIAQALA